MFIQHPERLYQICVREFADFEVELEFRGFVWGNKITAITQYNEVLVSLPLFLLLLLLSSSPPPLFLCLSSSATTDQLLPVAMQSCLSCSPFLINDAWRVVCLLSGCGGAQADVTEALVRLDSDQSCWQGAPLPPLTI